MKSNAAVASFSSLSFVINLKYQPTCKQMMVKVSEQLQSRKMEAKSLFLFREIDFRSEVVGRVCVS